MKILAIDTSCDETAAAVTEKLSVLSNIIWSQASLHSKFGGVMPSLAQRMHEERIDWVIEKALKTAFPQHTIYDILSTKIDAIAVTIGPGLAIALGVGIDRAKKLALEYKKPLIPVNHIEAHLLSPLVRPNNLQFPAFGLVVSGGNTMFVLINKIGDYKILAQTHDDALGEALDKAARLLGFGYPGASVLEKTARSGNPDVYKLPIPLINDKVRDRFSYSGLKTAFVRLVDSLKNIDKTQTANLAISFQNSAFSHIIRVLDYQIENLLKNEKLKIDNFLLGGGVANNLNLRKRLKDLCKKHNLTLHVPYSKKITGDNAAMIGVCAFLRINGKRQVLNEFMDYSKIDRNANLKLA